MRRLLIQKYKLDEDFELSQNYLFFYGMCVHVEAILKYKLIRSWQFLFLPHHSLR